MTNEAPQIVRLKDYRPPDWLVDDVHLTFCLDPSATRVISRIQFRPGGTPTSTLALDGENLTLISAKIDGELVEPHITPTGIRVTVPGRPFLWEAEVEIAPKDNTALEGLYMSGDIFCTQCEAEGFRRITYYPDRPDVMAPFTVRIEGDAPVLLSNGNLVAQGPGWAEWHDPWAKPSYLFALVAGDLRSVSGHFRTMEDRDVDLNIWVRPGDETRCDYALDSLIRAMKWDEEVYGRAYDLDVFNLVAVDDFNAGAMENKGLNIFNSKYVLASPETATDGDYEGIESVVAHEYFHNWTGNRITCRDWFQLCLKEGLTVFRDQEFTSDMRSRAVKRISDVLLLRAAQFREDQGPLAHPPRPEEYSEINNFYTTTVYEKGAEIVRMLHTILGAKTYSRALDLYFQRHDGQAATVEEFFACFTDVAEPGLLNGFDLWWRQAGTPRVKVSRLWDGRVLTLEIAQSTPPTPGQAGKSPLPLPLRIGVLAPDGSEMGDEHLIVAKGAREVWTFDTATSRWAEQTDDAVPTGHDADNAPTPSINRGFSAPVLVETGLSLDESRHLLAHDSDPFNRWDSGRRLMKDALMRLAAQGDAPDPVTLDAFGQVLSDTKLDPAFKSLVLRLPSEDDLAGSLADSGVTPDPLQIYRARRTMAAALGRHLAEPLVATFETLTSEVPYHPDAEGAARRALRLTALRLLSMSEGFARAAALYASADNMTEKLGALSCLLEHGAATDALRSFYADWRDTPGVIDKWFAMQVSHASPEVAVSLAERLTRHPDFSWQTPNRVRSVLGALLRNHAGFHASDGAGYSQMADWILKLDGLNPQIAAGLTSGFQSWARYDADRQGMMRDALQRISGEKSLSRDTREMVTRILGS